MRRRFLGLQTGLYVFVAGLLATPLGWLLMKVATRGNDSVTSGPFGSVSASFTAVPWMTFAAVVFVMPLVVGSATALSVRSAPTVPPRLTG